MSLQCDSNPDIAGPGVRYSLYIQYLLSLFQPLLLGWDGEITSEETKNLHALYIGILLTAWALPITAFIQAKHLSVYHTLIVLNLSWMNIASVFTFFTFMFIRRIEHRRRSRQALEEAPRQPPPSPPQPPPSPPQPSPSPPQPPPSPPQPPPSPPQPSPSPSPSPPQPPPPLQQPSSPQQRLSTLQRVHQLLDTPLGFSNRFLIIASLTVLHLTFVGSLGIMVWAQILKFGSQPDCTPYTMMVIFGHNELVTDNSWRISSIVIYAITAFPVLNFLFFAGLQAVLAFIFASVCSGIVQVLKKAGLSFEDPNGATKVLYGSTALLSLAIQIYFIVSTEQMINRSRALLKDGGDSEWKFGQVLALILIALPVVQGLQGLKRKGIVKKNKTRSNGVP